MTLGYDNWKNFVGNKIPSSLELYNVIFDYIKKDDEILDIGCGFGKTCFDLFENNYYNLTGIDLNVSGIQYANEFYEEISRKKPKFFVGDATSLKFQDNSYDFLIMQALLTAIPDKNDRIQILKEANRVLRKDGHIYLAVFCQTWHNNYYRNRYIKGLEITKEKGSFPAYNKNTGELDYIAHHYSEEELVELLINAGFRIIEFQYKIFTTRSRNKVNGMVVIAKKH